VRQRRRRPPRFRDAIQPERDVQIDGARAVTIESVNPAPNRGNSNHDHEPSFVSFRRSSSTEVFANP
jgi:hypothetical protein